MTKFEISPEIKNLDITKVKENLFFYKYDIRKLKNYFDNPTEELEHFYSSFKGEVYENIIYELLLEYSKYNQDIEKFILKGPHQKRDTSKNKSGLLIDRSNQIVYKASYKDITEFDALFFTKDEVYFVEMSTSKKTSSLNKRLYKKQAILNVLFPYLKVKALIILTQGSVGLNNFPSYCTVWITSEVIDDNLLKNIVLKNAHKMRFLNNDYNNKFIEANDVTHSNFKYFQTLKWILMKSRSNSKFSVDLGFFNSKNLDLYFDIYSKLYVGFLHIDEFRKLLPDFADDVKEDIVIVTIEKLNLKSFGIVYYPKEKTGQLKRVRIEEDKINIKNKEAEGFTNAEVKFMLNILQKEHSLTLEDINHINKNIDIIKPHPKK